MSERVPRVVEQAGAAVVVANDREPRPFDRALRREELPKKKRPPGSTGSNEAEAPLMGMRPIEPEGRQILLSLRHPPSEPDIVPEATEDVKGAFS